MTSHVDVLRVFGSLGLMRPADTTQCTACFDATLLLNDFMEVLQCW